MFANLTANQLGFLTTTNRDRRLEILLEPSGDPATGLRQAGFETVDACLAEDRIRADGLRKLKSKPWAVDCNLTELANLLDAIADRDRSGPMQPCLASAIYMRHRRIGILGAILELATAHPEIQMAWITTRDPTLCFHPTHTWSGVLGEARRRLSRQMEICGATTAPGFLMAYLTGYLRPHSGRFQLEFRGIAGGDKLKYLYTPNPATQSHERPYTDLKVNVHHIADLPRQLVGVMPNFLPELKLSRAGGVAGTKRMSEPGHSIYLTWLNRYNLADMWVMSGVVYQRRRLAISRCYEKPVTRRIDSRW